MAVSRQWENQVRKFLRHPVVRELVSRYVKESPGAVGNAFELVMHALIAPLCRGAKDEKRDGWRQQDSWTCLELFLQMGAYMTGGAHLSPAECELVGRIVSGERKLPRRRRSDNRAVVRDYRIVD